MSLLFIIYKICTIFHMAYAWNITKFIELSSSHSRLLNFVFYVFVPKLFVFTLTDLSIFNFREGGDWHTAPTLLQHRKMESSQAKQQGQLYTVHAWTPALVIHSFHSIILQKSKKIFLFSIRIRTLAQYKIKVIHIHCSLYNIFHMTIIHLMQFIKCTSNDTTTGNSYYGHLQ